jgi:hypothetical protein
MLWNSQVLYHLTLKGRLLLFLSLVLLTQDDKQKKEERSTAMPLKKR